MCTGRPLIVGPDTVEMPYPLVVETDVISGFGRGSSTLGIPTANIPPGHLSELDRGVYYGWARIVPVNKPKAVINDQGRDVEFNYGSELRPEDLETFPMVMSIGWNPFFKNIRKSVEIHILHDFKAPFYGSHIKVCVAGFIRDEKSYDSVDSLISDIKFDTKVALNSLARESYQQQKKLVE